VVKGWHLLDKQDDGFNGNFTKQSLPFLKNKTSRTVIVAVIDGGVDTTHEDLKGILWHNDKEIAGNKKDDDGNGYTDDTNGWNFLGNTDGTNVEKESAEVARLYYQLKPWFEEIKCDTLTLQPGDAERFRLWKKVNKAMEVSAEDKFTLKLIQATAKAAGIYDSVIRADWGVSTIQPKTLIIINPVLPRLKKQK
jgi:subtilisin family serine protease